MGNTEYRTTDLRSHGGEGQLIKPTVDLYGIETKTITHITTKCMACHNECGATINIVEVRKYSAHIAEVRSIDKYFFCEACFKGIEVRTFNTYKEPKQMESKNV